MTRDEQLIRATLEMAAKVAQNKHDAAMKWASAHLDSFDGETDSLLIAEEIRAIDPAEVLAGLRPRCAECDCGDGDCTWIKSGPDTVAGRPCTDCGQTHDTEGDLCPTCVCVRAEITAMEPDHD